jgi:hypothetical protein
LARKSLPIHGLEAQGCGELRWRENRRPDGEGHIWFGTQDGLTRFAWYLAIDKGIEALLLEEGSARLARVSGQ